MPIDTAALNTQLGIPGKAQVTVGSGGLAAVRINIPEAEAMLYLHGAHVASWKPAGEDDVLWISGKSLWQPDKAIRGGVPICFPWFGPNHADPAAPAHGFARLRAWELESIAEAADSITVTLALQSDPATKHLWPHDFILRHRVTFGAALKLALEFTNTGPTPATFEEAQHTYFAVGDVRQVRVRGLAGATYLDKTDHLNQKTQTGDLTIAAETDRPYLNTATPITLEDPSKDRRITITKEGSRSTVVWNPWIAKAKSMADFGDDEWPGMICIETCNVGPDSATVAPGQTHIMTTWLQPHRL